MPPSSASLNGNIVPSHFEKQSTHSLGSGVYSSVHSGDRHSASSGNEYYSPASDTGYSALYSSDGYSSLSAPSSDGYSAPSAPSLGSEYGASLVSSDDYNPPTSSHDDVVESTQMVAEPSYGGTSQGYKTQKTNYSW